MELRTILNRNDPNWIKVAKLRFLRKYEIENGGVVKPVKIQPGPKQGCNVELTQLTKLNDKDIDWWTLGFETYGTNDEDIRKGLIQILDEVSTDLSLLKLDYNSSYGYPTWLNNLKDRINKDNSDFKDYMLAEFKHISEALFRNEEEGSRRATFFLTISGAILTGLGFVFGSNKGFDTWVIFATDGMALFVLLFLGHLTYLRLSSRNIDTDRYKAMLNGIRNWFRDAETSIFINVWNVKYNSPNKNRRGSINRGGWTETVRVLNCFLAIGFSWSLTGLLISLFKVSVDLFWIIPLGVVTGLGFFAWEFFTQPGKKN